MAKTSHERHMKYFRLRGRPFGAGIASGVIEAFDVVAALPLLQRERRDIGLSNHLAAGGGRIYR